MYIILIGRKHKVGLRSSDQLSTTHFVLDVSIRYDSNNFYIYSMNKLV